MATDSVGGAVRLRRVRGVQAACGLTVIIVALRFTPWTAQSPFYSLIEGFAYNSYFDLRPDRDASQFVIVGIDEDSLKPEHQGRFPWRRSVYADLLQHLGPAQVVAFDILFAEPSPDDVALAEAIRQHGRVVLAAHKRTVALSNQIPVTWTGYGQVAAERVPQTMADMQKQQLEEFVPPVPVLAQAAAGIGYVDITPDRDGIYRRATPLMRNTAGHVFPHFSLEIARLTLGLDRAQLADSASHGALQVKDRAVPLAHGRLLINYAGPHGTVTTIPAWKVLAGKVGPDSFRDKIVIVGPTAAGLYDVRPAPFSADNHVFYGVETNANIARTLITGETLRDTTGLMPWGLYALIVGMMVGWTIWYTRAEKWAALTGVAIVLVLVLPVYMLALVALGQVIPYGAILLGAVIPMALALYERIGAEKRQVTKQFETYVSPDVLREIADNPDVVRHGQRRTVTMLFSDVRGSTTLAEKVPPDVWIAQLNEYLSEMSDAIFAYDGYLDKFMGDGLMAIWNAFGNQPDHAELATKSAAQMLERLKALNADWEQRADRVPFQIGIGLHTGEAIIGNVGSDRRTQYTAIGDAVNAASRIEALTKDFKAHLLISETTAELLAGKVKLVELGQAELKGRAQPLRIFKPEGYPGDIMGQMQQKTK